MKKTPPLLLVTLATAVALGSLGARADSSAKPTLENHRQQLDNPALLADGAVAPVVANVAPALAGQGPAGTASAAVPEARVTTAADDPKKQDGKFPLHASILVDNALGQGFYAPAFMQEPEWSTAVRLGGSAALPKLDWLPTTTLTTGVTFSLANWLPAYSNGGVLERQIQVSDVSLGISMPTLYTEDFTKISVSPSIGARIPISLKSRQSNLFTGLSGGLAFAWSTPEAWSTYGTFDVSYAPSVGFNLYTLPYSTIGDADGGTTIGNGVATNPLAGNNLPIAYCRSTEQIAVTGECALGGRQGIASFNNTLSLGWTLGNHSVGVSVGLSEGFLRPLTNQPNLDSQNASGQNFSESTRGSLSYSYEVPVDFVKMSLGAGVASGGPAWFVGDDGKQYLRFPLFNFLTPASNMSAAFFDVSVKL